MINQGSDGTLEWVKKQTDIDYVYSSTNIGICYGLNICRSLVKSDRIVYANDDMYMLPNWDLELHKEIQIIGHKKYMISGILVEPIYTGNTCVVVKNYGSDISSFKEEELLKNYQSLVTNDWSGSTWPPNVVHVDYWDLVSGMSIEFSPGMYSDPDFSRKLFEAGVRIFKGKGSSLIYHFGSKSTKRIKKNTGKKRFLLKWGITPRTFIQQYLQSGKVYDQPQTVPNLSRITLWINAIKRVISCW